MIVSLLYLVRDASLAVYAACELANNTQLTTAFRVRVFYSLSVFLVLWRTY